MVVVCRGCGRGGRGGGVGSGGGQMLLRYFSNSICILIQPCDALFAGLLLCYLAFAWIFFPQAVVLGAGHLVPMNQPLSAIDMLSRFLRLSLGQRAHREQNELLV